MSSADILDDSWPHTHGTPDGFDNDCRTVHCPAGEQYGLSCKTAKQLARSDYQYQKLARTGATVPEIADALGLIGTGPATAAATKKRPGQRKPAPTPQPDADGIETEDATPVEPTVTEPVVVEPGELAEPETDAVDSTTTADEPAPAPTSREIRAWAREKGYDVSTRGIIPTAIVEHYWDAHGLLDPTSTPMSPGTLSGSLVVEGTVVDSARPDYGAMNLENDLAAATDRIADLTTELAIAQTELEVAEGERDRARDLAVRLEQELARLEHTRAGEQAATAAARRVDADTIDAANENLAWHRAALDDRATQIADLRAALATVEKAFELVLQKWDDATRPGRPTMAIGGRSVVVEQFSRPPAGGVAGVAMAAAGPAIVRSVR